MSAPTFKVGDRVVFKHYSRGIIKGDVGTVTRSVTSSRILPVDVDGKRSTFFYSYRWEHATPEVDEIAELFV